MWMFVVPLAVDTRFQDGLRLLPCSEYQHFTELVRVDMLAVFGDNAERFVDLRLSSLSAHGEPTSFTIRTSGGGFEGV